MSAITHLNKCIVPASKRPVFKCVFIFVSTLLNLNRQVGSIFTLFNAHYHCSPFGLPARQTFFGVLKYVLKGRQDSVPGKRQKSIEMRAKKNLFWYNVFSAEDGNSDNFRTKPCKSLPAKANKKRPNTIPVFGPGKWLLGESRALKVGINAG